MIQILIFSEDEGEVFKVKKSSQSKRLAKRREKEKQYQPDDDSHNVENNGIEVMILNRA